MGRTHTERRKALALLMVAVLAVGVSLLGAATHLLRRSELQTINARFSVRGPERPPADIVFVGRSG